MGAQGRLPLPGFEADDLEVPLIYIASALSTLADGEKESLHEWCERIAAVVTETANESEQRWLLRVHAPVVWSAPSASDDRSPEIIYNMNSGHVLNAAALICIGLRGGSFGAGQEFGWACLLGIPVLYLAREGENISRQIRGTPADVVIKTFASTEDLADAVRDFLRNRRTVIENHRVRLRDARMAFGPLADALRETWAALERSERDVVVAESRVAERRIEQVLRDPIALRGASLIEIESLAGAMHVSPWRVLSPDPLPDLDSRQLMALENAAHEYGWPPRDVLSLHQEARLEMAKGGVRRFPLATTDEWVRFREKFTG